jgi:hypothetical protein
VWTTERSIDTDAEAKAIWETWSNVSKWPEWNGDLERAEISEPFAAVNRWSTRVPQQDPFAGGHSGELDGRRRSASSKRDERSACGAGVSAERQDLTSQRNGLHALGVGDDHLR